MLLPPALRRSLNYYSPSPSCWGANVNLFCFSNKPLLLIERPNVTRDCNRWYTLVTYWKRSRYRSVEAGGNSNWKRCLRFGSRSRHRTMEDEVCTLLNVGASFHIWSVSSRGLSVGRTDIGITQMSSYARFTNIIELHSCWYYYK